MKSSEKRKKAHVEKNVPFISSVTSKRTPILTLILRITIQVVYSLGSKYECHILFTAICVKSYSKATAYAGILKHANTHHVC